MQGGVRYWRITVFGAAKGPWRSDRRLARQDAIELGLGSYDEWGVFYTTVPGHIEVCDEMSLKRRA